MVHITDDVVDEVRHVVQRILVPCVFVIGLLGNSVSIYVLTRKRMRCTTNIYLTALAITDIVFLTMALLLSLQHYHYMHLYAKIYWKIYGTITWICDACAYISIYIAVCFTIERFIAIRYPLKRQTFCTESLAKKVIAGVAIFCILSTLCTAFEHTYNVRYQLQDDDGKPCNQSTSDTVVSTPTPESTKTTGSSFDSLNALEGSGVDGGNHDFVSTNAYDSIHRRLRSSSLGEKRLMRSLQPADVEVSHDKLKNSILWEDEYNSEMVSMDLRLIHTNDSCKNITYYYHDSSELGKNELYGDIWAYVTLIVFVLLPLILLTTFNCFLVVMVRRSHTLRGKMTNASSMRKPKERSSVPSVSQENRVTITLIAVVICFILCQVPWAVYLIVGLRVDIDNNFRKVLGNVFNFLADLNAAANFFLYCVLSDKYRRTIRELVTGKKQRRDRGTITQTSLYTHNASRYSYRPAPTSSTIK